MELACTAEEEDFRARLRAWLARVLPGLPPKPSPGGWPARRAHDLGWQRMLQDARYADVHWDASPTTQPIFLEETETETAGAPNADANFVGLLHAGPTIAAEGTDEQRARSPGPPSSPRCSSMRSGSRSPTGSVPSTTAGGSPW